MLLRLCFMCITVITYVRLNIEILLLKRKEIVLKVLVIQKYGYTADIFRIMF